MKKQLLLLALLSSLLLSSEIMIDTTQPLPDEFKIQRDNTQEVVIDKITGLMWEDDINTKTVKEDWGNANRYCKKLNFAGHHDWHLPTIAELETLIDTSKVNPAIKAEFQNTASDSYWSSSPVSYSSNAWGVYFSDGYSGSNDESHSYYVRCVRAGQ